MCSISPTLSGRTAPTAVQIEAGLKEKELQSRIHRRAARNRPLSERQKSVNTTRSKMRARVEHEFRHHQNSMGGKRTIDIVRARFKIGMMMGAFAAISAGLQPAESPRFPHEVHDIPDPDLLENVGGLHGCGNASKELLVLGRILPVDKGRRSERPR
jgi:hypothetical protein